MSMSWSVGQEMVCWITLRPSSPEVPRTRRSKNTAKPTPGCRSHRSIRQRTSPCRNHGPLPSASLTPSDSYRHNTGSCHLLDFRQRGQLKFIHARFSLGDDVTQDREPDNSTLEAVVLHGSLGCHLVEMDAIAVVGHDAGRSAFICAKLKPPGPTSAELSASTASGTNTCSSTDAAKALSSVPSAPQVTMLNRSGVNPFATIPCPSF